MQQELNLNQKIDFGKLIEWTFKILGRNFLYILKPMLYFVVPAIVLLAISATVGYRFILNFIEQIILFETMGSTGDFMNEMMFFKSIMQLYAAMAGIFFLYGLFILAANAACVKAVNSVMMKTGETTAEIVVFTLKKFILLILTSLISSIMVAFGLMCCYIPGIILMVYLAFIPQVVMLEETYFFKAIGRTFSLVNKNFWSIVLILIVIYFMFSFIAGIIGVPFYMIPYIKMINHMMANQGQVDPSYTATLVKDFGIFIGLAMAFYTLASIFYFMINNIALTLKFYNIKNLREGTALLDKIDRQSAGDISEPGTTTDIDKDRGNDESSGNNL